MKTIKNVPIKINDSVETTPLRIANKCRCVPIFAIGGTSFSSTHFISFSTKTTPFQ
ncbi:hypothetical protein CUZ89_2405 [Enterococcus xinjiangensis]|nr:hypothetical protein [Enterococcus lactis]MBL5015687.1 hypothetical protein [Enterococcus lactis]